MMRASETSEQNFDNNLVIVIKRYRDFVKVHYTRNKTIEKENIAVQI